MKLALGFKVKIRNWENKLRCVITTRKTKTILMYSFNLLYKKQQEICMYDTIVFCSWNYVLCLSTKAKPTLSIPHFPSLSPYPPPPSIKIRCKWTNVIFLYFKMHFCEIKQKKEENILKKGIVKCLGFHWVALH